MSTEANTSSSMLSAHTLCSHRLRRHNMRRPGIVVAFVLALSTLALAHVSVQPRESKANVEERYTVRVPTEGNVATTHVILEVPAGVTVLEILPAEGTTSEVAKDGARITTITWKKEIPPKAVAEFAFRARNPGSGDLIWKAHQHFADGTVADWIGPVGDRRPAAITKLIASATGASVGEVAR